MKRENIATLGRILGFFVPLPVLVYYSSLSLIVLAGSVSEAIGDPKRIIFPLIMFLWILCGWFGIITIYVISKSGFMIEGKSWIGLIAGLCAAIPFFLISETFSISSAVVIAPISVTLYAIYLRFKKGDGQCAQPVAGGDATRWRS